MPQHYSPGAGFVIAAASAIVMERLKLPAVLGYIAAMLILTVAISVHQQGFTWRFLGMELLESS